MLTCCLCGAEDHPIYDGLDDNGQPINLHYVKPEVIILNDPKELTLKHTLQGWSYKFWQGRHTRIRMICVDCLMRCSEAKEAWKAIDRERNPGRIPKDDYYRDLCND